MNSPVGVVIGGLAFVLGFAMVWWIWWLAALSGLGIWAALIVRSSDDNTDIVLDAAEVERLEVMRLRAQYTPARSTVRT